jgi:hypothetical protein
MTALASETELLPFDGELAGRKVRHSLFALALNDEARWGGDDQACFYARTALDGHDDPADLRQRTLVAYLAFYPEGDKITRLFVPVLETSLTGYDLLGEFDRSYIEPLASLGGISKATTIQRQSELNAFGAAAQMADRYKLPVAALACLRTQAGEERVEFLSPAGVKAWLVHGYIQAQFRDGQ